MGFFPLRIPDPNRKHTVVSGFYLKDNYHSSILFYINLPIDYYTVIIPFSLYSIMSDREHNEF